VTGAYDITLKHLIEAHPADWLPLAGHPTPAPVAVIDADLATVAASADKIIRVDEAQPWLLHIELQTSPASDLAARLQWYNTLLHYRHGLPVRTLLVLLHRRAESPQLNGRYQAMLPGEEPYLTFAYRVIRMWERPAEEFLQGGTVILPLVSLANVAAEDLPTVIRQMDQRLTREVEGEDAATLRLAAGILAGLRLSSDEVTTLFQEVFRMKESSTYQVILEEGRREGRIQGAERQMNHSRELLLRMGTEHLGEPPAAATAAVAGISDLARLDRMTLRAPKAASWDDLLQTP
jgi:predicted transposase YdaD